MSFQIFIRSGYVLPCILNKATLQAHRCDAVQPKLERPLIPHAVPTCQCNTDADNALRVELLIAVHQLAPPGEKESIQRDVDILPPPLPAAQLSPVSTSDWNQLQASEAWGAGSKGRHWPGQSVHTEVQHGPDHHCRLDVHPLGPAWAAASPPGKEEGLPDVVRAPTNDPVVSTQAGYVLAPVPLHPEHQVVIGVNVQVLPLLQGKSRGLNSMLAIVGSMLHWSNHWLETPANAKAGACCSVFCNLLPNGFLFKVEMMPSCGWQCHAQLGGIKCHPTSGVELCWQDTQLA